MTETANPIEASVAAYGDTFLLAAGIALAGAILGTILSRPKQLFLTYRSICPVVNLYYTEKF